MYEKAQVWPDLVNIFQIISLDDFLYTHLDPCRHTNDESDIPSRRLFYNLFQLARPVAGLGYLFAGLIKRTEPERYFLGRYSTEVTFVITGTFLQICTAPNHQPTLSNTFYGNVLI